MRGLCMLLAMLIFCSVAVGQDFGQLLKAVRKVETDLKLMVEEERVARESQVAALRGDIDNMAGLSGSSPKLQAELNSLRAEVDAIKDVVDETNSGHAVANSQRASVIKPQHLAEIWNDIAFLKSENKYLRYIIDNNPPQLAVHGEEDHDFHNTAESPTDELAADREEWENPGLEISGFFDVVSNYEEAAVENGTYSLGQAELDLARELTENITVEAAIAYNVDDGIFELGAALVDIHLFGSEGRHIHPVFGIDHTGVVVGQFDVPFGIDWSVYASIDRRLVTAPQIVENTHDSWNDFGFQAYLGMPIGNFVFYWVNGYESTYEVTDSSTALSLGVNVGDEVDTTPNDAFGGRLGITPVSFLEFGSSFAVGSNKSHMTEMFLWGADIKFEYAGAELKGEAILHQKNKSISKEEDKGFYVQSLYDFGRPFVTVRYGGMKFDSADKWQQRISMGFGYALGDMAELRAEYQINNNNITDLVVLQLAVGF